MKALALFLVILAAAGCRTNTAEPRAAGYWPGAFVVDGAPALKGYLQLYVTDMKFKLFIETAHQNVMVQGPWTVKGGRVRIQPSDYHFEMPSEEDQKAMRERVIPADAFRSALAHGVVLDESADRRHLIGLRISLQNAIGRFEFERPIPR